VDRQPLEGGEAGMTTLTAVRPPEAAPPPTPVLRRLAPKDFRRTDAALLAITLASSFAAVWIVFAQLTFLSGPFGFLVCWLGVFLGMYWLANVQLFGRDVGTDRLVGALVTVAALCLLTPLALLTVFVVVKGYHLLSVALFVHTQKGVLETCVKGFKCPTPGLAHAIVGTLEQVALAALMGVPAAVLTAIFLNEVGGRFTRSVRVVVTAMSGLPAIVAGVFIYSMWIVTLGQGFSGFAGAMALAVLLLPTVTRGTEEVLKIVPNDLREASTALAAPEWRTVWSVVLPTARSGMVTSVLLGIAVAIGETAPLLLTIFGNNVMNANPFTGKQSALPLLAFTEIRSSRAADVSFGYAAALVLFLLVFIMFVLARVLGSNWFANVVRGRGRRSRPSGLDALRREMSGVAARGAAGAGEPGVGR
jgi:phosphate transport system permease protein